MILFPENELSASQQPIFTMFGEENRTILVHNEDKHISSLSIMRYRILTELIEIQVSLPDDIIYNNVNQPLQFKDISSLEEYHGVIYSEVNNSFQDQKLEKHNLTYGTDTPPSSLSIAMSVMMHLFIDQGGEDLIQWCDFTPMVTRSFKTATLIDDCLDDISMKTSNYTPSAEDLACHSKIFEDLHANHNSTITTTNIKGNLAWVPLLDMVKLHQTKGEDMLLGKNVPHMKIHFTHICSLTLCFR